MPTFSGYEVAQLLSISDEDNICLTISNGHKHDHNEDLDQYTEDVGVKTEIITSKIKTASAKKNNVHHFLTEYRRHANPHAIAAYGT